MTPIKCHEKQEDQNNERRKTFFKHYLFPSGFKFPQSYLDLVEKELPDIDPWWWLAPYKDSTIFWADTLCKQFPSRIFVPFAKHGSSDNVACVDSADVPGNPKVFYIRLSKIESRSYEAWAGVAIVPAAPFALAEYLSPEIWKAMSIFLNAAK